MNPEQLITQACVAISEFERSNVGNCLLRYKDGEVRAYPTINVKRASTPILVITTFQQSFGLSSAQCNKIGSALYVEYLLEASRCPHQKP